MSRTFLAPERTHPRTAVTAVVALLALAAPAGALTIRVHPDSAAAAVPNHVATILEANTMVAFGDSIEVSNAGTPYLHDAAMSLVDGVVYRGGFGPDFEGPNVELYETTIQLQLLPGDFSTVIDAAVSGDQAVFAGFTVTGGNSSFSAGGMFCGSGIDVTVRNCRFVRNYADVVGGGILLGTGSTAFVYNCDFDSCSAGERGGGVALVAGADAARIEFCRFNACSASTRVPPPVTGGGGGVFTRSGAVIRRNTFQSCWSGQDGGALLARDTSGLAFNTSWMFDNVAVNNGGAILQDGGDADYFSLQIERCSAGAGGGAAYFQTGTSSLRQSFIRDCVAVEGGGIYYEEPTGSEVTTSELVSNQAGTGGGIQIRPPPPIRSTTVEIRSNTFAFNGASGVQAGGGIHIEAAGYFFDLVQDNILAFQTDGAAIACFGALSQPTVTHNLTFNNDLVNQDPEYDGTSCDDRTGISGNLKDNPDFCDSGAVPPQLGLLFFSPAVGSGTGGLDMGAHQGTDCVTIRVEPTTWGKIKSYYR